MNKELDIKLHFVASIYYDNHRIETVLNDPSSVAKNMSDDGYCDGRKEFAVETIEAGVCAKLKHAINRALSAHFKQVYGDTMTAISPGHNVAESALATDEVMSTIKAVGVELADAEVRATTKAERRKQRQSCVPRDELRNRVSAALSALSSALNDGPHDETEEKLILDNFIDTMTLIFGNAS